nr:MAG TPA: hypothetical protein [Caudoviricetes sp.]
MKFTRALLFCPKYAGNRLYFVSRFLQPLLWRG